MRQFFIFGASSGLALAIDLGVFTLLDHFIVHDLPFRIALATVGARLVSSLVNFSINCKHVFNHSLRSSAFYRYYLLWFILLFLSALLVSLLSEKLTSNNTLTKFFVDLCLFFLSFIVQKKWVFAIPKRKMHKHS